MIHVVDASGSTDLEGRPVRPGTVDPVEEALGIQKEVDEWFYNVIRRIWENKISRHILTVKNPIDYIVQNLSGLSIKKKHVVEALRRTGLESKKPAAWSNDDIKLFSVELRKISKPIIIAANKCDLDVAMDNIKELKKVFGEENVIPVSALAEYILRKASLNNYIEYLPGDNDFKIVDENRLSNEQRKALKLVREKVLIKYGSTGVQKLLNHVIFNVLKLITVYPVENHHKYTDHRGNILPDAYLVPQGTTTRELAYMIHTDLGKTFLYAINAKTGEKLGENYELKDNDVIKIVATAAY
ncbi:MAG: redox-regulated ATPase YchF [Desulfurococcales archaeon ex4484_58]|nr:MAG: redox-regulated ATPase YchF [Desulfurococcales archaeon ex4484_58]